MKGRTNTRAHTASRVPRCAVSITETPRSLLPAGIAVYSIPTDRIVSPDTHKHTSPPESIAALAQSIHKYGIIHPITVKALPDGTFMLVSGLRRLNAIRLLGYTNVLCIVISADEASCRAVSLCENVHTHNMHYLDIAEAIGRLCERYGYTTEEAAGRLCISLRYTHDKLRLLEYSAEERSCIKHSDITEQQLLSLLAVDDGEVRALILSQLLSDKLSREGADRLISTYLRRHSKKDIEKRATYLIRDVRIFYNTVERAMDVMRRAGYSISAEKTEYDDYTILSVRIPK